MPRQGRSKKSKKNSAKESKKQKPVKKRSTDDSNNTKEAEKEGGFKITPTFIFFFGTILPLILAPTLYRMTWGTSKSSPKPADPLTSGMQLDESEANSGEHLLDIGADLAVNTDMHSIGHRLQRDQFEDSGSVRLWRISDILDTKLAQNVSQTLEYEFMDSQLREQKYAFTHNRGNTKIRGNDNIESKMEVMKSKYDTTAFAYCKYEYTRHSPVYTALNNWLNSTEMISFLSEVLDDEILMLTDMFITAFGEDQYLSNHNDWGLGKYAMVFFLSEGWSGKHFGGQLQFHCVPNMRQICHAVTMEFNSLNVFQVYPNSAPHSVEQVKVQRPRLAVTGWFTNTKGDGFNKEAMYQQVGNVM